MRSADQLVREILEGASTRALGWILEQHCHLVMPDETHLTVVFHGNHRMADEILHEEGTRQTLRQILRTVTGHDVEVDIVDAPPEKWLPFSPQARDQGPPPSPPRPALSNQGRALSGSPELLQWQGLSFRSKTEVRIAEALDDRRVLFLANCRARLGLDTRVNREADFLVCWEGRWGILEVDGEAWHPATRTTDDHTRDRLFKAYGIRVIEHFDAAECWENADGVVEQFLRLLAQG
jgi:hypothetical protein